MEKNLSARLDFNARPHSSNQNEEQIKIFPAGTNDRYPPNRPYYRWTLREAIATAQAKGIEGFYLGFDRRQRWQWRERGMARWGPHEPKSNLRRPKHVHKDLWSMDEKTWRISRHLFTDPKIFLESCSLEEKSNWCLTAHQEAGWIFTEIFLKTRQCRSKHRWKVHKTLQGLRN